MWFKRKKPPNDGRQEKIEAMQKKSDAIDALMRSLMLDKEERRHHAIPDFTPERRHA